MVYLWQAVPAYFVNIKRPSRNNHFSLLRAFLNYGREKFNTFGHQTPMLYNILRPQFMYAHNKLEHLSLAGRSSLFHKH
jgi:hypothetical protein